MNNSGGNKTINCEASERYNERYVQGFLLLRKKERQAALFAAVIIYPDFVPAGTEGFNSNIL
jgi:hypothetical protein